MALAASRDVVQTYLLKMVFIREPFYELEDFFFKSWRLWEDNLSCRPEYEVKLKVFIL